jgi:hypothetical protein
MKKTFPLQLTPEMHRRMKHASFDADETLHEWILKAIELRLESYERNNRRQNGSNQQRKAPAKENK